MCKNVPADLIIANTSHSNWVIFLQIYYYYIYIYIYIFFFTLRMFYVYTPSQKFDTIAFQDLTI